MTDVDHTALMVGACACDLGPLVVLLGEHGADQAGHGVAIGGRCRRRRWGGGSPCSGVPSGARPSCPPMHLAQVLSSISTLWLAHSANCGAATPALSQVDTQAWRRPYDRSASGSARHHGSGITSWRTSRSAVARRRHEQTSDRMSMNSIACV